MSRYTTDDLIKSVRRRATIPSTSAILTTEDLAELATDELLTFIVPKIMTVREDYFLTFKDFATSIYNTPTGVQMPIPSDAVGSKLRDVCIVNSDGQLTPIERIDVRDLYSSNRTGYYIENSTVILYPKSLNVSTIRMYYISRPAELVLKTDAGSVIRIQDDGETVILSRTPFNIKVGESVQFTNRKQPFNTLAHSIVTEVNGSTIKVESNEGLSLGAWCSLSGTSPVPQIPVEAHMVLAQAVTCKALEAMGDAQGLSIANDKLERDLESMFIYISPRVDSAPIKIISAGDTFRNGRW